MLLFEGGRGRLKYPDLLLLLHQRLLIQSTYDMSSLCLYVISLLMILLLCINSITVFCLILALSTMCG